VTARELLNRRAAELRARDFHTLAPAVESLAKILGDVDLTHETERFLTWFQEWDSSSLLGLAALVVARDNERDARRTR
jgi:hypothetical protein